MPIVISDMFMLEVRLVASLFPHTNAGSHAFVHLSATRQKPTAATAITCERPSLKEGQDLPGKVVCRLASRRTVARALHLKAQPQPFGELAKWPVIFRIFVRLEAQQAPEDTHAPFQYDSISFCKAQTASA
eukprot:scaffold1311_cov256-Pinguiococcus_pyrenoidosus.AAC.76